MTKKAGKKAPGREERTPDIPELPRMLGHHLRRAHLSLWRKFNDNVGQGKLRPGQFGLLSAIEANPGISQIEVSRLLDLDKATVVSLMTLLEKSELAMRRQSAQDRRRYELFLTPKGKRKITTLRKKLYEHEDSFRKLFTRAEFSQFIEFLQRVYQASDRED